jgi:hypothetical protein
MAVDTVIKFSSWNVQHIEFLSSLWPNAKIIFIHRHPIHVVHSFLRSPPSWLSSKAVDGSVEYKTLEIAKAISANLRALFRFRDYHREVMLVGYDEIPQVIWGRIAPSLELSLSAVDLISMQNASALNSKKPSQIFVPTTENEGLAYNDGTIADIVSAVCDQEYERLVQQE